jgi:uncharacterized protein
MAVKKAKASAKKTAKAPAKKAAAKKKTGSGAAAKKAKPSPKAKKAAVKKPVPAKKASKPAKKEVKKSPAKPQVSKSPAPQPTPPKPVEIDDMDLEMESNTTKIADMIVEKKTTKAKATKSETKEKKPSARALKAAEKAAAAEPLKEHRFSFKLKEFGKSKADFTTEEKLQALFQLQLIDSEIDRIRIIRGELPMEVIDLEDEIAGLQTRIQNYDEEVQALQTNITQKKLTVKEANAAIKKYESQQMNVKNNREFDSLNKEIEFQQLEIQLAEKRVKEYTAELAAKNQLLEAATQTMNERLEDLKIKKAELDNIIAETRKEEDQLLDFAEQAKSLVDERLVSAYTRIRENAKNGLAVVTVQRDACGGCFNKIPPQRQLDIRQHKKIIVCEHCGRILVDHQIEL